MKSQDSETKCASCGLLLDKSPTTGKTGHLLCSTCTLNGIREPRFKNIVYAVAIGYFMDKEQINEPEEALRRAKEFVAQLPYWQDKELPNPTLEELIAVRMTTTLLANMDTLEYDEELLELSDFFFSHSWAGPDKELVDPLVAALKDRGYHVWYDKDTWGTETGKVEDWMKRGVERSRYCVTVLCQPYFDSKTCMYELDTILTTKEPNQVFPIWWNDINKAFLERQENGEKILEIVGVGWNDWQGNTDILVDKLIQLVNHAEGLKEYNGVPLVAAEARLLDQLELFVHETIPPLKRERPDPDKEKQKMPIFGFYHENNHITALFLEDKELKALPKSIGNLAELETLNLKGNSLKSLPKSFSNLKTFLNKKYPQISEPEAVVLFLLECWLEKPIPLVSQIDYDTFGFTANDNRITALSLSNQGLKALPESLDQLSYLEVLNLAANQLKTLPKSFGQLVNLQNLEIRRNELKSLPKSFGNLSKLETLNLQINHLKFLPESFSRLVNLQKLSLHKNQLEALPESIGNLTKLEKLWLYDNRLGSLPKSFDRLTNLKVLNLVRNQLKTLPESVLHLTNLQALSLSYNQLESLPESIGDLEKLEKIWLDYNKLKSLPEPLFHLTNLQKLDLAGNQFKTLPESIGNLRNLQILSLNINQLQTLPDSLGRLSSLKELYLYDNRLQTLPEDFGNLPALQKLFLNNNRLQTLPENFSQLKSLRRLELQANRLNVLPESFGDLTALEVLDLGWNQLQTLPELFANLINLQKLKLMQNQLRTLPKSFRNLKNLKTLDISKNPLANIQEEREKIKRLLKSCTIKWE